MKTKNEFQGNKSFKAMQSKKLENVLDSNILQNEELLQIKGGDEVEGTVRINDID
jgi:hypothetical protein